MALSLLFSQQALLGQETNESPIITLPRRVVQDEPEKSGQTNAGIVYRSKYYWRVQWFYGASAGVFLPYIAHTAGSSYFYLGGELGENLLLDSPKSNESGFGEVEKDWTGIDLGAARSFNLWEGKLGLNLSAWYFWYFRSKDIGNDDIDNSFADLRAAFSLKEAFLTPTLTYSHYLRVDEDYSKRTTEDYYITLGISRSFQFAPRSSINLAADINYWHYASKEESPFYGKEGEIPTGISDATLKSNFSIKIKDATLRAGFNYAYVFDEKFDYTSGDTFDQNKFWTNIGVDIKL